VFNGKRKEILTKKNNKMKDKKIFLVIIFLLTTLYSMAQENVLTPNIGNYNDSSEWVVYNRDVNYDNGIHLNAKYGNGFLRLKNIEFKNGRIELDIRGKDEQGRSFVGIAFHGENDSTYDAIYFRPFNFKNPDRNGHSIQYISHPVFTWNKLRQEFPEKYENKIVPVPEPNNWFHVTITIRQNLVEVYVENSETSSLKIEQLSSQGTGWIGFWVGNNSEGYFRNLKIIQEN
jgi:hypothetical protein